VNEIFFFFFEILFIYYKTKKIENNIRDKKERFKIVVLDGTKLDWDEEQTL